MYKLIRLFNQNRKKFVLIILIIVFAFLLLQLLNYFAGQGNKNTTQNAIQNTTNLNIINNSNSSLISNQSQITGENISASKLQNDTDTINKFMEYCNKKDITNAYNLLSDDCKKLIFPTVQDFYNNYYLKIFDEDNKTYTIENWTGSTYTVRITGNILSTGNLSNSKTNQDYMTIVKQENESKLNINNYVTSRKKNQETSYKNIKVNITQIDTYMDYEIYNLTIENNSENTILMDTSDNVKSIYLSDENDMKYYFYSGEIIENRLKIESGYKSNIKIKFTNTYSSTRKIKNIIFSKFVLNYNEYLKDKENYQFYQFLVNV